MNIPNRHRISVAPMMDLTDRHFRFLMRCISTEVLLYTEMVTAKAVVHGDAVRLLQYNEPEHPVALQLGGSDPDELVRASVIGREMGYDEINLNVGCPSDRVKSGRFGACLMAEPALVGRCVRAMADELEIPVTVKCRIGIDRNDTQDSLFSFVEKVAGYGCTLFIVHARKAWLDGLSPKENRTIPPLRYDFVYQLKQQFPDLTIIINGGIDQWSAIDAHLAEVDGVMIGREAYYNPAFMLPCDSYYQDGHSGVGADGYAIDRATLESIARQYAAYMQMQLGKGVSLNAMTRHLIALFQGVPGAKAWRQHYSERSRDYTDALALVNDGLALLGSDKPVSLRFG